MRNDPDFAKIEFCRLAIHYHILGRFGLAAGFDAIIGTLFHHALENALKAFLIQKYTLAELASRRFGHKLMSLWEAFKNENAAAQFGEFDDVVGQLDRFERLRYPDSILEHGAEIHIGFLPDSAVVADARVPRYSLCVRHLDLLMGRILEAIPVNPPFFLGSLNPTASDYLTRYEKPYWAESVRSSNAPPQIAAERRSQPSGLCGIFKSLFRRRP